MLNRKAEFNHTCVDALSEHSWTSHCLHCIA